jgi:hypothetical protein
MKQSHDMKVLGCPHRPREAGSLGRVSTSNRRHIYYEYEEAEKSLSQTHHTLLPVPPTLSMAYRLPISKYLRYLHSGVPYDGTYDVHAGTLGTVLSCTVLSCPVGKIIPILVQCGASRAMVTCTCTSVLADYTDPTRSNTGLVCRHQNLRVGIFPPHGAPLFCWPPSISRRRIYRTCNSLLFCVARPFGTRACHSLQQVETELSN